MTREDRWGYGAVLLYTLLSLAPLVYYLAHPALMWAPPSEAAHYRAERLRERARCAPRDFPRWCMMLLDSTPPSPPTHAPAHADAFQRSIHTAPPPRGTMRR